MPELPEVQNMVNYLKQCEGQKIIALYRSPYKLRFTNNRDPLQDITNSRIEKIYRIAKYIIINLNNKMSIILHAGMSGIIFVKELSYLPIKHDHVIISLSKNTLVYNDPRRFGLFLTLPTQEISNLKFFHNLGVDALSAKLTPEYLYNKIKKSQVPIKQTLLNQKIIAGCGNIYANETLYQSQISPFRPSQNLSKQELIILINNLQKILHSAILHGGSTLKDYRKPDGNKGSFQTYFQVYGKENQPCPRCIANKIECKIIKTNISNRSSFYCVNSQK